MGMGTADTATATQQPNQAQKLPHSLSPSSATHPDTHATHATHATTATTHSAPVLHQPTIIHARLPSAKQHLRHVPGSEPASFLACSPRPAKLPAEGRIRGPPPPPASTIVTVYVYHELDHMATWPHGGPFPIGGIVVSGQAIKPYKALASP